jgi:hydroxyacyl-ACP dehydratase HTD2-like protein with hotdog domain
MFNAKLKCLSGEYQVRTRYQHNPAARDPTLRTHLNYVTHLDEAPFQPPIQQPRRVYRDTTGNYVYKNPIENLEGTAAALQDIKPEIAQHPSIAYAQLLCTKALVQQSKATSSQGKLASKAVACKSVVDTSNDVRGKSHQNIHSKPPS